MFCGLSLTLFCSHLSFLTILFITFPHTICLWIRKVNLNSNASCLLSPDYLVKFSDDATMYLWIPFVF
jgi:hypothetical protein